VFLWFDLKPFENQKETTKINDRNSYGNLKLGSPYLSLAKSTDSEACNIPKPMKDRVNDTCHEKQLDYSLLF